MADFDVPAVKFPWRRSCPGLISEPGVSFLQLNNAKESVVFRAACALPLFGSFSKLRVFSDPTNVGFKGLNKRLAGKLRITIVPDGLRQPLRDFLQGLPGVGERKTEWVDGAQDLTVMGLVAAVREGKDVLPGKGWGLTSGLAETLNRMTPAQLYALEAIDLEDRVSLELNVSHTGEQYRSLDRPRYGYCKSGCFPCCS